MNSEQMASVVCNAVGGLTTLHSTCVHQAKMIEELRQQLKEQELEIECRASVWQSKEGEYETEIAELQKKVDGDCTQDLVGIVKQAAQTKIDSLKEEVAELRAEKERDTIAEVRSARDRALQEVDDLKEFRQGVADYLELADPELVEPEDVSNALEELRADLEDERDTCGLLKNFAMKVHNQVYGTDYDDEDIATSFDYDCIIGKMIDDEKEQ